MKSLNRRQIEGIIRLVNQTREREFNCAECLKHISEFAESQVAGQPLDEELGRVAHHLEVCMECREEYEALLKILRANP